MKHLLLALLALLAGCTSTGHEDLRQSARSQLFHVHALERATAERVLMECEALAPLVLAQPTSAAATPVEIYCVPVKKQYGEGRNLTEGDPELRQVSCIEIDIGRELSWERFVIAHELAHSWLAPEWNPLPQILEEGLADMAGSAADPQAGVCRRLFHGLRLVTWAGIGYPFSSEHDGRREAGMLKLGQPTAGLPTLAQMLELDATSYHDVGGDQNENLLYAVGFALVQQIGVPALKALCARANAQGLAQIPADWLLEAAGLTRATDQLWAICGMRLIGTAEEELLQHCLRDEGPFRFGKP
ncbi:MAG: hypothetical protein IPJ19_01315 [Planctomycetes bacterium]|nr:hypothetical protein [Planctomycetota bacterium]